jgi:hypothetical protein
MDFGFLQKELSGIFTFLSIMFDTIYDFGINASNEYYL